MKYFKAMILAFLSICGLNMLVPDLQAFLPRWQKKGRFKSRFKNYKTIRALTEAKQDAEQERRTVQRKMSKRISPEKLKLLREQSIRLGNKITKYQQLLRKEEAKPELPELTEDERQKELERIKRERLGERLSESTSTETEKMNRLTQIAQRSIEIQNQATQENRSLSEEEKSEITKIEQESKAINEAIKEQKAREELEKIEKEKDGKGPLSSLTEEQIAKIKEMPKSFISTSLLKD